MSGAASTDGTRAPRRRDDPLSILEHLVAFNTESARSNRALIAFVADFLDIWQVPYRRIPNATGDKEALFATLGPIKDGGVLLSGHTDVVPATGQNWTSDPFRLRVAYGRAHGRGTVDMKGFCALALALVPDFLAADLARPVHLLLSYDEEVSCLGTADAIAEFGHSLPRPGLVLVGEPTDLEVIDAHRSVVTFTTTVHGQEAHASKPMHGANAVMAAGDLVAALNRIADAMILRGDPSGRFDPPATTVHVGRIAGGSSRNVLPKLCSFNWEFRGLPNLDMTEIPRLFAQVSQRVTRDRLNRYGDFGRIETREEVSVPSLAPDPGSEAERLALSLSGHDRTKAVPYATEAGRFQQAGLSTVVCGPGSIDQAHQPDEFITLDALQQGEDFLRRLIAACSR